MELTGRSIFLADRREARSLAAGLPQPDDAARDRFQPVEACVRTGVAPLKCEEHRLDHAVGIVHLATSSAQR